MKKPIAIALILSMVFPSIAQIGNTNFGALTGFAGSYNSAFGYGAGYTVTGTNNAFMGYSAGGSTTSGDNNVFIGFKAGFSNTLGFSNHFSGSESGFSNTGGYQNIFLGANAGYSNTSGYKNFYSGFQSGYHSTIGIENYFAGFRAGFNNVSGSQNHFAGYQAGFSNVTGSGNLFMGYNAGYHETGSNKLYIDNSDTQAPLLYGDFSTDMLTVNGKLGIGTAPIHKLDINGVVGIGGVGVINTTNNPYDIYMNCRVIRNDSPIYDDGMYINYNAPGGAGSHLRFYANGLTERMRVSAANGYVGIANSNPAYLLHVNNAYCDGNTWYNVSDKNLKENFARIRNEESILAKVMELPIQYWNYKTDKTNRHIGPTAQDFHKVFKLGNNEKAISTIDESGVALAAIQELYHKTEALAQLVKEQQEVLSTLLQSKAAESDNSLTSSETGLKLHQNQPNPFQRDTKIAMEIPHQVSLATLYVYDLQGKTIEKQVVTERGVTTVTIEGGRLNSGIYLYTLIGDNKATEVKKMILTD